MSVLLKKDAKVSHVITTSVERSKALDDEARVSILHVLSHKPLSVEEIAKELRKSGFEKAVTTIRHHLEVLRDCGLIEVVKAQEVRGAVLKYYASTVKYLGFENSFDPAKHARAISDVSSKLLKIADSIVHRYGSIRGAEGSACLYCSTHHSKEYVVIEILNRAIAEMTQSKEFSDLIKSVSAKKSSNN